MIQLETEEQLQTFLTENPDSIILKHSTSCSISAGAYREFKSFARGSSSPTAVILVIEARRVSNKLAEITDIPHKSPQIFFFHDGKCYKNASHYDITAENIKTTLEGRLREDG